MTKTITVEGDITAVDTATGLTTQGSVSAPSLVIPAGKSLIKRVIAAVAHGVGAAGSAVFILRLGGGGVKDGEQVLVIGAGGFVAVQAGSDQAPSAMGPVILDDVDIAVSPSNVIRIQAEMAGSDLGTAEIAVTLVYE